MKFKKLSNKNFCKRCRAVHHYGLPAALVIFILFFLFVNTLHAQTTSKQVKSRLSDYFINYKSDAYTSNDKIRIENLFVNNQTKSIRIILNDAFASQPFTPESVDHIYAQTKENLPEEYQSYKINIFTSGTSIEELIPINISSKWDSLRTYITPIPEDHQWVTPMSLPYTITQGLQGRHLCVWASHGRYFRNKTQEWVWQRPPLYCTTEDLFTQTIVIPYLIPMLENAGAVVFSPRERDWQKNEVIVDNDTPKQNGIYAETTDGGKWNESGTGFARLKDIYFDFDTPFSDGTARKASTVQPGGKHSSVVWTPNIQADGEYAVYVSYKTVPNSINDANYTVIHQGSPTTFRVNQKMGGSTWVYLGTFYFNAGESTNNCVILTNESLQDGVVTADAVRFGGGMGNIARKTEKMLNPVLSGMPRFLEAARYSAQWYGMPYEVYSAKEGVDDYGDDLNSRPRMLNYLSEGSFYNPGDSGLNVPIELSLACHSDAGFRKENTHIGTLGVYTTRFYEGKTATGLSRLTSRDLTDMVISSIKRDITTHFGQWNRRQMYDKNYCETREPQTPSMILEMLSHQNWADLKLGHDPYFKFIMARSIYKGILKYIKCVHNLPFIATQPLPVCNLSAHIDKTTGNLTLAWEPSVDPTDPSSAPTQYIIYISEGGKGFDNGSAIPSSTPQCMINIKPKTFYRFRVAAVNEGGRSLLSDEVCAYYAGPDAPRVLLIDGFNRVAGPKPIDNDTLGGFDLHSDPGVIDVRMPGYCGYQQCFSKKEYNSEGPDGIGFSGNELEGLILAGNSHDYTTRYASELLSTSSYTIASCQSHALYRIPMQEYIATALIMGAQKEDGYSLRRYKTFTAELRKQITEYVKTGGNILVSGAFIGSDMQQSEEQDFTKDILKYSYAGSLPIDSLNSAYGMNTTISFYNTPNESNYWIKQTDILQPTGNAFTSMLYTAGNHSAVTAYQGADYRCMAFGFPIECIIDPTTRTYILTEAMKFLIYK